MLSKLCCIRLKAVHCLTHMIGARHAVLVLQPLERVTDTSACIMTSESLERLQAMGAAASTPQDTKSEEVKAQLAALQGEQASLKRQLVGLQQAEAGHLKTISEVPPRCTLLLASLHIERVPHRFHWPDPPPRNMSVVSPVPLRLL